MYLAVVENQQERAIAGTWICSETWCSCSAFKRLSIFSKSFQTTMTMFSKSKS